MELCDTQLTCLMVYSGAVVLFVTTCAVLAFALYVHHQHVKYAHIPAPPRDGFFLGHIALVRKYQQKDLPLVQLFMDISMVYGPVFHVFMLHVPLVHLCDTDAVKSLLMSSAHRKPNWSYGVLTKVFGARFLGNGLVSQTDPAKHAKRRSILNSMFTRKCLVTFVDQFNASADILVQKLGQKADAKTEVAMLDEFTRTTLDVIAKVAFSLDVNTTIDDNAPFSSAITTVLKGISFIFHSRSPQTEFSPLPAARRFRQEVRDSIKLLRETGRQCIEQRLRAIQRQEEVPGDILTHMLKESAQLEGDGRMGMEDYIDEFVTLFFAGQETTANLLSFCLVELGNHPEIMQRLRTEVKAVLWDKDRVDSSDVGKLTYMMQVLKETLRLWPPATGTLRQLAHDMTARGYKVPAGSLVSVSTFVMARMEEYFQDPLEFDPDRFQASDDKPSLYFPFSLGPRNCIGQQFALIEARVLLARLLKKFHFDLVPGQGYGIRDEITLKPMERCRNYIRHVDDA